MAGSGRVIVRLTKRVDEGHVLCDGSGVKIAKVMEMIGPVDKPYASASPLTNNTKKIVGKRIFASDVPPTDRQQKQKRTRKRQR